VTQAEPKNTEALVILGFLYANTNLKYAPTAEQYFLAAQRAEGRRFLLPAHRGLLFAYYYQGRFKKCLKEAELTLRVDPKDETAKEIRDLCLQKK
jgi:hypothetical protein